tara:strand:- start:1866 stop:2036 length:171 start_codon:yes stop_codon:yes gene_type:complete
MPRQAKVIVPGFPHHIVQRVHNRQSVFVERRGEQVFAHISNYVVPTLLHSRVLNNV